MDLENIFKQLSLYFPETLNKIIVNYYYGIENQKLNDIRILNTYQERLNKLLDIIKGIKANKRVSPGALINKILPLIIENYDIKYTQVIISTLRHNQIIRYKNKELVKYFAQIYNLLGKYHIINHYLYKGISINYNVYFLEEVISNGSKNIKELCDIRQSEIDNKQRKEEEEYE